MCIGDNSVDFSAKITFTFFKEHLFFANKCCETKIKSLLFPKCVEFSL